MSACAVLIHLRGSQNWGDCSLPMTASVWIVSGVPGRVTMESTYVSAIVSEETLPSSNEPSPFGPTSRTSRVLPRAKDVERQLKSPYGFSLAATRTVPNKHCQS